MMILYLTLNVSIILLKLYNFSLPTVFQSLAMKIVIEPLKLIKEFSLCALML